MKWLWQKMLDVPDRQVLLERYDGNIKIVSARPSQSGFIASYYQGIDNYILLADGRVAGDGLVKHWAPHAGWDGTEFGDAHPFAEAMNRPSQPQLRRVK